MANVATFEMIVRGKKDDCINMLNSGIPCYDLWVLNEDGNGQNYTIHVEGECRWSAQSIVYDGDADNMLAKSKEYNVEIELFGYDKSEPEWIQHYHYRNGECLKKYELMDYYPGFVVEEGELSEENKAKYTYNEEHDIYTLKEEYKEKFQWDDENYKMILPYIMIDSEI